MLPTPSRPVAGARFDRGLAVILIATALLLAGCVAGGGLQRGETVTQGSGARSRRATEGADGAVLREQTGLASWYSDSLAGHATASGRAYDPARRTAAHRALPFGTVVRVTRTDTGRAVEVVINDRGPFGDSRRVIDLSRAAAQALDMLAAGVVPVRVVVLQTPR